MWCMLQGLSIKASEVYYTRGMQDNAQMAKPAPNRPYAGQNSSQNGLRWWLERQENEAHAMAHKQGIKVQLSNTLKEW